MASLHKRANPSQRRMLRIVEGAVKNAAFYHPAHFVTDRFARSIAKRAVGTLSAQWPEVLAAKGISLSPQAATEIVRSALPRGGQVTIHAERRSSHSKRRPPLDALWHRLKQQIRPLREAGENDLAEAYVEIMKTIHACKRGASA